MLSYAKERKYTTHGELFSAHAVVDVIEAHWRGVLKARVIDLPRPEDGGAEALAGQMVERFAGGRVVYMVPYDMEYTEYLPVKRGGKTAHWMAATGSCSRREVYSFTRPTPGSAGSTPECSWT